MSVLIGSIRSSLQELADSIIRKQFLLPFAELACQVFDDTGLSDAIDNDTLEESVDTQTATVLRELSVSVDAVDQSISGSSFFQQKPIGTVLALTEKAIALLIDDRDST